MIVAAGRISGGEDRRFSYPLMLTVIGLLCVVFALIDGRPDVILQEGSYLIVRKHGLYSVKLLPED